MWCCKDVTNNQGEYIEETHDEHSDVKDIDVKEWNLTLRENIVCMDEHNVKIKRQKIEASEQIETGRREARKKKIEEREMELSLQQHILETSRLDLEQERERKQELFHREEALAAQQQDLDEQEKDLEGRGGILEIVVHMNETQQRISLPLRILQQQQEEEEDRMLARETQLEEEEEELIIRQRELEEREVEMDEKNAVLEIAIRVNDQKRNVIIFLEKITKYQIFKFSFREI